MKDRTRARNPPPTPARSSWPRRLRRAAALVVLCALTILAELAFNVLGGPSGWLLGAGAVFLLAIGGPPLQRLAHHEFRFPRVAGRAERARLYREQAMIVWQDHMITRRERILLDHLRARLSLTADEAARLEQEALESTAIPRP